MDKSEQSFPQVVTAPEASLISSASCLLPGYHPEDSEISQSFSVLPYALLPNKSWSTSFQMSSARDSEAQKYLFCTLSPKQQVWLPFLLVLATDLSFCYLLCSICDFTSFYCISLPSPSTTQSFLFHCLFLCMKFQYILIFYCPWWTSLQYLCSLFLL